MPIFILISDQFLREMNLTPTTNILEDEEEENVVLECRLCKEKKEHIISLEKENEELRNQIGAYDKLYHL